jgi:hypothetical protein
MKKLCLILLFLNTTFAAEEPNIYEKRSHTKSSLNNAIYGLTLVKCQKISQILGEKYGNNPENSDFDWSHINKIFLVGFFKACAELNLLETLHSLSAKLDVGNQQVITTFLTNFDEHKSRIAQKIENYEIRNFFHQFIEIENLIFKEFFK